MSRDRVQSQLQKIKDRAETNIFAAFEMSFFQEVSLKLIGNNFIKTFKLLFEMQNIHASRFKARKFIGMHECKICKVNGERIDHIKINACRRHAGTSKLLCRW